MIKRTSREETVLKVASTCDVSSNCKTCMECCKRSSGYVLDEDIPRIAKHLKQTEEEFKETYLDEIELFGNVVHKLKLKKYPIGECVFLTKQGCGIHKVKPLHCKLGTWDSKNSQGCYDWFMLNKLVNKDKPESIRQWHAHLKYRDSKPISGGSVGELVSDKNQLKKIMTREI